MINKAKRFTIRALNKAVRILDGSNQIIPDKKSDVEKTPHTENNKKILVLKENITVPHTIYDLKSEYCSGCGACVNTCPVNALEMGRDPEGYLLPILNNDKCINCGKCVKTCPVINTKKENTPNPDCYAVMANDDIRMKSSSGGVFSVLAKYVLDQNGYVCGVAFDESFNVKHIIIDNENDLEKLRGSKYVQSDTNDVFIKIKKLLNDGKLVLFSGCPCQVAGLNGFLQKKYDNLITVDLVCHGGPSQMIFDRYISEYYGKENLKEFKFRTKEFGYNCTNQIAYLNDGTIVAGNVSFDPYEKCMHSSIALKKVCSECPFAAVPRQSDITIGDFWGISQFNPALNDGKGTSVVLINNERGEELWKSIRNEFALVECVPFDIARRNNSFGGYTRIPSGRNAFFTMLKNSTFEKSINYALQRKYDVGIVGLWFGENYGSMATYYALHHTLNEMGLSVLMIENCLRGEGEDILKKTHPRRMVQHLYDISAKYSFENLKNLNQHCDTFIVGSDQLWNVGLSRAYKQIYFLDFVDDYRKKISVATSFGKEYGGTAEEKLISSHNLQRFDAVSVRDTLSKTICKEFGVEATEICDPTLLCDSEIYDVIGNTAQIDENEPYILAYILDPHEKIGEFLHQMAVETNCKVKVILDLYQPLWNERKERLNVECYEDIEVKSEVDLSEWFYYYKHASAVITDSFHGTIFSVIYQKPFITKSNSQRGAQRFVSLLTPLGLENRLFDEFSKIENPTELLGDLDYTIAYENLTKIRKHALDWLKNALYAPKEIESKAIYSLIEKENKE